MSVSEKKKASNAKWDKANMVVLSCKVRKEKADAFKAYAAQQGKTGNTLLKEYVMQCIREEVGHTPAGKVDSIERMEHKDSSAAVQVRDGDRSQAKEIVTHRTYRPNKEIKDETLRKIVDDMHDTKTVREHTADDFLEDLDMMISNFVSMMRRSFRMKAEWAKTDEDKERVQAKLNELDASVSELRETVK